MCISVGKTTHPTGEEPPRPKRTPFQQYADGAGAIQSRCACIRWDPRECIEARYHRPMDDIERHGGWEDCLDDTCECRCHDEIRDLETDIWGDRDDD